PRNPAIARRQVAPLSVGQRSQASHPVPQTCRFRPSSCAQRMPTVEPSARLSEVSRPVRLTDLAFSCKGPPPALPVAQAAALRPRSERTRLAVRRASGRFIEKPAGLCQLQRLVSPPSCPHVNHVLHAFLVATARNITLALDEETLR